MPYTIIENFKAGMVRNVVPLGLPAGSLVQLTNGHVSQAGEIENNKTSEVVAKMEPNPFYGLLATSLKLYTFGSVEIPGMGMPIVED